MKINLQRKSSWMEDFSLQDIYSDNVTLRSQDGVSLFIPTSLLVASSGFLGPLLHSHCSRCSNFNPVICLPSVSGLSLKLFSQILCEGETEQLSRDDIIPCLDNVKVILDLLGCKFQLVTKLGCNRAHSQIKIVGIESLAQEEVESVKEEFKDIVDISMKERTEEYSKLIVKEEVGVGRAADHYDEGSSHSSFLQEEVFGKSYDRNQNVELCEYTSRSAPESSWRNTGKSSRQKKASRIIDKGKVNNSRREFQCSLCDLGFFTSVGLERHTSEKHGENHTNRKFKCVECNLSYYTKNSLLKHKHEKHSNDFQEDWPNTSESTYILSDEWIGPFSCTKCDYYCQSTNKFSKHWNQEHPKTSHEATFIDTATSTSVTLYQVFAFIVRCNLCGLVRCSRTSKNKAVLGIKGHLNNIHSDQIETGVLSDMYTFLQEDNQRSEKPEIQKVPSIPKFSSKRSFCKKGFKGPYHCLSEGCGFVCDKFGKTTQKLLANHWVADHGDVKDLLYLDKSSFSIINVKIICNNVGYCNHEDCDQILFAGRTSDFQTYVSKHWKLSHSSTDDSFNPKMCRIISSEHVPDITEKEAVALVSLARKSNIYIPRNTVVDETENGFDNGRNTASDEEFEIEDDIFHGDVLDNVSTVTENDASKQVQTVAYKNKQFKCPLKCTTVFKELAGLKDHLQTFHGFNNVSAKKIIKVNP